MNFDVVFRPLIPEKNGAYSFVMCADVGDPLSLCMCIQWTKLLFCVEWHTMQFGSHPVTKSHWRNCLRMQFLPCVSYCSFLCEKCDSRYPHTSYILCFLHIL